MKTLLLLRLLVVMGVAAYAVSSRPNVQADGGPLELRQDTEVEFIGAEQVLHAASIPDTLIVDVRQPMEYAHGHIPHAINLPNPTGKASESVASRIIKSVYIIIYGDGQTTAQARMMADELHRQYGIPVVVYAAGWPEWMSFSQSIE